MVNFESSSLKNFFILVLFFKAGTNLNLEKSVVLTGIIKELKILLKRKFVKWMTNEKRRKNRYRI